jgi:hypothetical protein
VGRDIAIIMQGHHNVSLDLLASTTLDSLFDAQAEVLVDVGVSVWPSLRGMEDRYVRCCLDLARL